MKEYHTELVEQTALKNSFQERLNALATTGWRYVNHIFVSSYDKNNSPHKAYVFSVVFEKEISNDDIKK